MAHRRYGISTHLFHRARLGRNHLAHIAAHGFEAVELFAARDHFDYHDAEAGARLAKWLADVRLDLHSVHAPIAERCADGRWVGVYSNAAQDEERRAAAVAEVRAAIGLARCVPFQYLVLHLGVPADAARDGNDNRRDAARRSIEDTLAAAAEAGVRVALEVIPNALSQPEALVDLIEEDFDGIDVGICLDYGHAHLSGDVGDAVEAVSGHLWTTHLHDNRRRADDHLVPFDGTIDWDRAIMATQKIGYEGALMLELAAADDPVEALQRAAAARDRLDRLFITS